ncbi:MAG: NADH-quinone oxidoreductase subunit A [Saprospiraceae bacterium]
MNKAEFIQLLPMMFMLIFAGGFVSLTMFITHKLGPSRKTQIKLESFECGIEAQGNARNPMPIRYFLVAILFVLFDVEIIFMYPWAVNFKELGIQGFVEMLVFIAILFIGFIYIIKRGALKWTN